MTDDLRSSPLRNGDNVLVKFGSKSKKLFEGIVELESESDKGKLETHNSIFSDNTKIYTMPTRQELDTTFYTIKDSNSLSHSLAITNFEKDLRVWITLSLCPSIQYQKSYGKAMQSHATIK